MPPRLYLDNAATSFPKPPGVLEAMRAYAEELGASAGRGAYREAVEAGEMLADCRRRLARLVGAVGGSAAYRLKASQRDAASTARAHGPDSQSISVCQNSVVFTLNCTEALNLAIKGVVRAGDHVVASRMDHNSILRPLNALRESGAVETTLVKADPKTGRVSTADVAAAIRPHTRLVCLQHASNVTGTLQPIAEIAGELARRGVLFLVDAAQTAGHVPIDVRAMGIDFLAMPGHKGLLGPLGTGALYIRPGVEKHLQPLVEGGTGSESERPMQPDFLPDKYESGSHNAIGIAGLRAALEWVEDRGVDALREHDVELSQRFIERTRGVDGLTVHGPREASPRVAVFSVSIEGLEPAELSALLETEFGIMTRSGLHCAPLAHETIGTSERGGTARVSFGALSTLEDVDRCCDALAQLSGVKV